MSHGGLMTKKIGFLGPEGSFSHQAAIQFSKKMVARHGEGWKLKFFPLSSISLCIKDLEQLNYSVIPIENSTNGQVIFSYDLLRDYCNTNEKTFQIIGEEFVPIHHNLLSGAKNIEDVKVIYSHPQVWSQCSEFFKNLNIKYVKIDTDSTSKAAQLVSENIRKGNFESAAICNSVASKIYNLDILQANIEDNRENTTRFLVLENISNSETGILSNITNIEKNLSRTTNKVEGHKNQLNLISITSQNSLIFDIFTEYKMKIKSIISRPSHKGNWNYMFFIEYYDNNSEALQKLKDISTQLTFLGSINKEAVCINK